jgi:hypothetical protein
LFRSNRFHLAADGVYSSIHTAVRFECYSLGCQAPI